jgi:hypothetical protein
MIAHVKFRPLRICLAKINLYCADHLKIRSSSLYMSSGTVALLGDSIFDNEVYVRGHTKNKSVITLLIERLKELKLNYNTSLLAVDGNVVKHVMQNQVKKLPNDSKFIFVSVGGNNALQNQSLLYQPVKTVAEGVLALSKLKEEFQKEYTQMLDGLEQIARDRNINLAICTVYNPRAEGMELAVKSTGLAVLNDVIIHEAVRRKLPVIDLRTIFNEFNDYANPIEPSQQGGEKIVRVITDIIRNHDFANPKTVIYS